MSREDALRRFLSEAGRGGWTRQPLAGDASARRYERITDGTDSLILMDADPASCGPVQPFLEIRKHLYSLGFSAPALWAEDVEAGFLLLEDFGDALFAKVMARDPGRERPLYRSAADLLARLHEKPLPPGMTPMSAAALAEMIAPAFTFYAPDLARHLPDAQAAFAAALQPLAAAPAVLALRDFHAENMVVLPDRSGDRLVGLLDFQDAFATHPAYDLVSMLQDARRDLSPGTEAEIVAHFIARTGADPETFNAAYALLGAQRNLRILGIFSRLAEVRNKPQYLALQPRVWRHLQADLAHPALTPLRAVLAPLPSPEVPA